MIHYEMFVPGKISHIQHSFGKIFSTTILEFGACNLLNYFGRGNGKVLTESPYSINNFSMWCLTIILTLPFGGHFSPNLIKFRKAQYESENFTAHKMYLFDSCTGHIDQLNII